MCASFVSIPVTVSCPSCTACIVTISDASSVPFVALCLALTVTCIGTPFAAGSSLSAKVKVEVVLLTFEVVPVSYTHLTLPTIYSV